jgi:hypothetical protein
VAGGILNLIKKERHMYIASYKQILADSSLDTLVNSLKEGLRADIPYGDTQTYSYARITSVVVKGQNVDIFDNEYGAGQDTVDLIMEMENGIRGILEPGYDSGVENGAAIVALLTTQQ